MADHRDNPLIDCYAQLDIGADASAAEIDAAYRRLARSLHPDSAPPGAADVERLQRVLQAHATLSSPARRRDYDKQRQRLTQPSRTRAARPCPICRGSKTIMTPCGACAAQGYQHFAGQWLSITRRCARCNGIGLRRVRCGACAGSGETQSRCRSEPGKERRGGDR